MTAHVCKCGHAHFFACVCFLHKVRMQILIHSLIVSWLTLTILKQLIEPHFFPENLHFTKRNLYRTLNPYLLLRIQNDPFLHPLTSKLTSN